MCVTQAKWLVNGTRFQTSKSGTSKSCFKYVTVQPSSSLDHCRLSELKDLANYLYLGHSVGSIHTIRQTLWNTQNLSVKAPYFSLDYAAIATVCSIVFHCQFF
uniref:Uncharacterized protein n=1 Tax=Micrurus spixii TaxID=129469 RepID=A0A2D4MYB0_9SAUR